MFKLKPLLVGIILPVTFACNSFAYNNIVPADLALNKHTQLLSEYDALNTFMDLYSDQDGTLTVFKNQALLIKLQQSHGLHAHSNSDLKLITRKIINDYSEVITTEFPLKNILTTGDNFRISVATNDDEIYLLLTSTGDHYQDKKNLLLKSNDAVNWTLFKSFPSELDLSRLNMDENSMSLTCSNCEDVKKAAYMISTNKGLSWKKHSLPEASEATDYSSVMHDKLFSVSKTRDVNNRKKLVPQLMYKDLTQGPSNQWHTANMKHLLKIPYTENDRNLVYAFNNIDEIYDAQDVLVADVKYSVQLAEDVVKSKYFLWLSKNEGKDWELLKPDFKDQYVNQFEKHNGQYHIVTMKDIKLDYSLTKEQDDKTPPSEEDALDFILALLNFFQEQKYSYYQMNLDVLEKASTDVPAPKFEFTSSVGYNLNYTTTTKTRYTDAGLIRNTDDGLKLQFYRLFDH